MIIKCYNCNKSFSVKDVLIPITGRLLECGKCKNRWFYKPNNLFDDNLDKNDVSDSFVFDNPEKKKEKESYKFETINNDINYSKVGEQKKDNKQFTSKKYLNNLIVFLISFVAIIILFDSFKEPISVILPGLILLLDSLYETIHDLQLFLKDLFI